MSKVQINISPKIHSEHIKLHIFVLMTLTLVQAVSKIINIEIVYDLDWNSAFVKSGDLNF